MAPDTVSRNAEWIEREYGREKWPEIERWIEAAITDDPDGGLGRIVGAVARRERRIGAPLDAYDSVYAGQPATGPVAAIAGAHQGLVVDAVVDACTPDTGLVLELGSGWGRNLLLCWLAGAPAGARYVAAEYTEAGRRASERLAALDPRVRFSSLPFDYRAADFSSLEPVEHAVVYSVHSVEQVDRVPVETIDAVRGLAQRVTCLHFEPVGWQLGDGERTGSSAGYAEKHDYNRNLVELLRGEAAEGRLRIDAELPEVLGLNPRNATTVVAWSSPV